MSVLFVYMGYITGNIENPSLKCYIKIMINKLTIVLLAVIWLNPANLGAQSLPEWMIPLREAIYEQKLTANEVVPLYNAAKTDARQNLSGTALNLALCRCEYFMGRALLFEDRNAEAKTHFSDGLRIAENLVQTAPSAEAWVMRAENLSYLCQIGPWTFTAANGLSIEEYAKAALRYNSRNAAAQYLIAARWVYAPAPFHNHRKGIDMMSAIIENGDMDKDDFFNVYSAIGYAYIQQKKHADARTWLQKSIEIYPTNKYVNGLIKNLK